MVEKYPIKATFIDQEKKINLDEGIIPFILTSKVVDRDSEVILPNGGDVKNFSKNPVFLWAHDMWSPPIGRVLPETIIATDKKMTADVKFDLNDPFAAMIFDKYANGFLNAGSIRFRPIKINTEPVLPKQKRSTIEKWELLEFSGLPLPSNPEALSQVAKGLKDIDDERAKDWAKQLKEILEVPLDKEKTLIDVYIDVMNKVIKEPDPIPEENDQESIVWFSANVPGMMEKAVTEGIQKALNPLLMDEFQYMNKEEEPEWILLANAMINLFHNKTLPDYQKRYVYDHLAEQYKKFDRKPPEFGKEPEEEKEPDEKFIISEDSINKIIETVTKK